MSNTTAPKQINLTWDEWEEMYKPVQNNISRRGEFNGWLFETYDEDLEHIQVMSQLPEERAKVWTLMTDDNGNMCISEGYHHVNRVGYFVTENPVGRSVSVFVQDEDDINDEDEIDFDESSNTWCG